MTRKRLHTLLGFILLIMLASPTVASAQPPASANTLTQDDIEFIFGPEANIADFKQLSPQEMAETQGEFFSHGVRHFLKAFKIFSPSKYRDFTASVKNYWSEGVARARSLQAYHRMRRQYPASRGWTVIRGRHDPHHREITDGLKYKHWQVTRYKKGVKGSHVHERFNYGVGQKQ